MALAAARGAPLPRCVTPPRLAEANDRFKGKQFTVTGSKSRAAAGEGCFGKLTYKPDGYQDRISACQREPRRGVGAGDDLDLACRPQPS